MLNDQKSGNYVDVSKQPILNPNSEKTERPCLLDLHRDLFETRVGEGVGFGACSTVRSWETM